ncbi:MAG: glycosyltransferase family 4 protein [Gemmataceae bacterium]|nr:glycosyltransferase family 4 protein [Gemmataceae bacterium]
MRVVLNQWPAAGQRTGVGHYTAELIRLLPAAAGSDEVYLYPSGWALRCKGLWQRLGSGAPAVPSAGGRRFTPLHWLRAAARGLLHRCGRLAAAWRLSRLCARQGIDLYHEPNYVPFPADVPTVITVHDLSVLRYPEWHPADRVAYHERHFRAAVARCSHLLTVSDFTRQEVIRLLGVPPERVTRVHNGVRSGLRPLPRPEVEAVLQRLGLPPRYLLHVGTVEPRKNLLLLLRAYCSLPESVRQSWPLVLVGGWGWRAQEVFDYWHHEARHRGVLHVGYAAEEDLPAVYNAARALLCPSRYEGFGLPTAEMLACGGAVICSTAGALVETTGPHAHRVDPADLDGWRDSMARVVADDAWWRRLRQGTVEAARAFTWERCAAETWAVYRAVHSNRAGLANPRPHHQHLGRGDLHAQLQDRTQGTR